MEIKNMFKFANITNNLSNAGSYVPSSLEKNKAMMMYLFFGIMVSLSKQEMNPFEYYHLKQASGWRMLFLLVLIFDLVLLFVPIIKYLGIIPLLLLLILWIISVMHAKGGKYFKNSSESWLFFLSIIGNWFIELFEIAVTMSIDEEDTQIKNKTKESEFINIDKLDKQMDL